MIGAPTVQAMETTEKASEASEMEKSNSSMSQSEMPMSNVDHLQLWLSCAQMGMSQISGTAASAFACRQPPVAFSSPAGRGAGVFALAGKSGIMSASTTGGSSPASRKGSRNPPITKSCPPTGGPMAHANPPQEPARERTKPRLWGKASARMASMHTLASAAPTPCSIREIEKAVISSRPDGATSGTSPKAAEPAATRPMPMARTLRRPNAVASGPATIEVKNCVAAKLEKRKATPPCVTP